MAVPQRARPAAPLPRAYDRRPPGMLCTRSNLLGHFPLLECVLIVFFLQFQHTPRVV